MFYFWKITFFQKLKTATYWCYFAQEFLSLAQTNVQIKKHGEVQIVL